MGTKSRAANLVGKGSVPGSFFPMVDVDGRVGWTFSVWTNSRVEIQFEMMKKALLFEDESLRIELLQRLNAIPGVHSSRWDHGASFYSSVIAHG
jgi:inosine/xanthosine triphosphate pyrophosphatase family protein